MDESLVFRDREEAGKLLSQRLRDSLQDEDMKNLLILALPRGGVPVGFQVARELKSPLDVLVARKLGLLQNPEFGFGAIAPGDVIVLDQRFINALGLGQSEIDSIASNEMEEMRRRIGRYRSGQWSADRLAERPAETVIVVDDGLATGVTARAALESAKILYKPRKLIFAVPVCARESAEQLKKFADQVVCVSAPYNLRSVGQWYLNFPQVSDEEVVQYLEMANE